MKEGVGAVIRLLQSGDFAAHYGPWVALQEHPAGGLLLLNYTPATQYQRHWDEVTRACRGLILDTRTWQVAAWPFAKFFNVNERPETCLDALPQEPFAVYEKVDGALGVLYRGPDGLALASRGAFTSEQARRGTEMLRRLSGLDALPEPLTLVFEIVYPGNAVIPYGFEGLVLLAGFDRFTGAELPWNEVQRWADHLGCRTPRVYPFGTLAEVVESQASLPANLEGYVVRFASGLRVKLKGEAYLTLHKLAWGLSEKRILEAVLAGRYDDFLRTAPEEFRDEIEKIAAQLQAQAAALEAEVHAYFRKAPRTADRKTFALWVRQEVPVRFHGALFQLLDGRSPNGYQLIQL